MKKYTCKELRRLVKAARAIEANTMDIPESVDKIGLAFGSCGLAGALLQGRDSGKLYAITARCSNLFRYV